MSQITHFAFRTPSGKRGLFQISDTDEATLDYRIQAGFALVKDTIQKETRETPNVVLACIQGGKQ